MTSSFSKSSLFQVFPVHTKTQSHGFKFKLKSVFRDGLLWTVSLTVGINWSCVFKFRQRGVFGPKKLKKMKDNGEAMYLTNATNRILTYPSGLSG